MIRSILLLTLTVAALSASASSTQRRVELENQIQQRVSAIVQRIDPLAMVQVSIKLRRIEADLPGVSMDARVTPVEFDGQLGTSSIESVSVRVLSQIDTVPDWIRAEVDRALKGSEFRFTVNYEKAGGTITDGRGEFSKIAKEAGEAAVKSLEEVKKAAWGILGALVGSLLIVAFAIFGMARRMEKAFGRLVEEKVVPAMQAAANSSRGGGGRAEARESTKAAAPVMAAGGVGGGEGGRELKEFSHEAICTLIADCYWTENDGYAHYLWKQMSQAQKEKVLAAAVVEPGYFSYIREVPPVNLDYHSDPRYLAATGEFNSVSQTDTLAWLKKNPKNFRAISPMRWDSLALSLEERIRYSEMKVTIADGEVPKPSVKSKPRVLPSKLQIRTLRAEDEDYLWSNHGKVPADTRPALRSLVWLALAPLEDRKRILSDMDAQQLAEAWAGPEPVLAQLKEALPARKLEMLEHFSKTIVPSRDSDSFAYLVDSGLNSLKEEPEIKREAA